MAAPPRRKKMLGLRKRRVEDEGEEDHVDMDDDSLTEGSMASDDNDHGADSDTSNIDEASPVVPNIKKTDAAGNGAPKVSSSGLAAQSPVPAADSSATDTDFMMTRGAPVDGAADDGPELDFDEAADDKQNGPLVVSSSTAPKQTVEPVGGERRRREHEEYRRKRDEDPAFVPNRGAFFMHDHRHAGPAANGFRPFGRGRGRGRGGPPALFPSAGQFHMPADPLTSGGQWSHDMHEAVANPMPSLRQHIRQPVTDAVSHGPSSIRTCSPNPTPINRTMSTEKHLGNVQVRVSLENKPPVSFGMPVKQYTKLPDHRPPLRRDKPVRISLPDHPPKYIFPAVDRSFIFIPRAMRPNQQRSRGKLSGLGSVGGYSRRTSVFGGSYYGGSTYSPSIALSRRSSLGPDARDYLFSPTGSVVSRPAIPVDTTRPVVRLPPAVQAVQQPPMGPPLGIPLPPHVLGPNQLPMPQNEPSITELPPPQTHPLPQKPSFQESNIHMPQMHQPHPIPSHGPASAAADADTAAMNQQPFQQAFHQQVPVQVSGSLGSDTHVRQSSYPARHATGTPLSQIPERAIHAAPFQPNTFAQQNYYGAQPYGMMQPQQPYYYPSSYNGGGGGMAPSAAAPPFVPASQQQAQGQGFPQPPLSEHQPGHHGQPATPANTVAQEMNGTVYYYDAVDMTQMNAYPGYQSSQGYGSAMPTMNNVGGSNPNGFYYPQQTPGMVYYPQ